MEEIIREIANEMADRHSDIDEAVNYAYPLVAALPEFMEFVRPLVENSLRLMIWERRKSRNRGIRATNGNLKNGPKVLPLSGDLGPVNRAAVAAFNWLDDYHVASGLVLGDATGAQLVVYADKQLRAGYGHIKAGRLFTAVRALLPSDEAVVRSKVSSRKVKKIWEGIEAQFGDDEGAVG